MPESAPAGRNRTLAELMSLQGRVALVTGGSGKIGFAFCEALAEQGASVAVVDLPGRVDEAARELAGRYGVEAAGFPVDLGDFAAVRGLPEAVRGRFARLDVLVNCAALIGSAGLTGWSVGFAEQSLESWSKCLDVNLTAAFVLSQAAAPLLAAGGHGAVINVSSIYGVVGPDWRLYEGTPLANPAAYAATKGALVQLTRWLATTLAPRVRVNAISPGGVARNQPQAFVARYEERTPLQRMATEEDFKGAVAYLASDLSAYVTGQNLMVDGGWTAW